MVEGGGYGGGYFRLLTSLFQHEARVPNNEDAHHTSMPGTLCRHNLETVELHKLYQPAS